MNIINWIKSEYVTFIGNALLSLLVWRVSPSDKWRVSRLLALWFPIGEI